MIRFNTSKNYKCVWQSEQKNQRIEKVREKNETWINILVKKWKEEREREQCFLYDHHFHLLKINSSLFPILTLFFSLYYPPQSLQNNALILPTNSPLHFQCVPQKFILLTNLHISKFIKSYSNSYQTIYHKNIFKYFNYKFLNSNAAKN